jgi:hypothetical protein
MERNMTDPEILDAYHETTTQAGADIYMAAYHRLYGIDPAPYWAPMDAEYGVELALYEEKH